MTKYPRRQFLVFTTAGIAAASLPLRADARFRGALAGDDEEATRTNASCDLSLALADARRVGKPLLLLHVPDTQDGWSDVHARRRIFGEYLNLAAKPALADLALCEVACVDFHELEDHFDPKPEWSAKLAFLVEPGSTGAGSLQPIELELPEVLPDMAYWSDETRGDLRESIEKRAAAFAAGVHSALVPGSQALELRAAKAQQALGELDARDLADALIAPENLTPELADRAAALVALAAETHPAKELLREKLAEAAKLRLVKSPPRGAKWAKDNGCGFTVEGEPPALAVPCGTGFTSPLSQRFLHFYRIGQPAPVCGR